MNFYYKSECCVNFNWCLLANRDNELDNNGDWNRIDGDVGELIDRALHDMHESSEYREKVGRALYKALNNEALIPTLYWSNDERWGVGFVHIGNSMTVDSARHDIERSCGWEPYSTDKLKIESVELDEIADEYIADDVNSACKMARKQGWYTYEQLKPWFTACEFAGVI